MRSQRELSIEDVLGILRRRMWLLVIPAATFTVAAYAISLFLPARYNSETVVLVEGPAVPADIVKPIVAGDTNQRLATMREEILSRTRLQQIIDKFSLYRDDLSHVPTEELVVRLRNSIEVSAVRPMDRTNANGLPGFTIDVTASQALLAQQICSEITSMFLQQNVIVSERKAEDTAEFLTKQLHDAKAKLDDQDARLAQFQRRYLGSLPDEAQTNLNLLAGLSVQLESATQSLNRAQQDKLFLQSTLSQQIAASKLSQSQTARDPNPSASQLKGLQDQLQELQTRYTEDHPDVMKLKNQIAQLQGKMEQEAASPSDANQPSLPGETPPVEQLRAQLHQLDMTILERTSEQSRLQQEIKRIQGKLELTPAVAQQYKALTRDYQTALGIYNDFLKKQSDSEVSRDLLRRQQGEQFRVLDPPSLPQRPTFPNRRLFAFGGFASGLGVGLAIAFLMEARDTTLHTEKDVAELLKLPTLASIPLALPVKRNGKKRDEQAEAKATEDLVDQRVGD